jgi:hypothetical protein
MNGPFDRRRGLIVDFAQVRANRSLEEVLIAAFFLR